MSEKTQTGFRGLRDRAALVTGGGGSIGYQLNQWWRCFELASIQIPSVGAMPEAN